MKAPRPPNVATFSVLPDGVRQLSPDQKLQRLAVMNPELAHSYDVLITTSLEQCYREQFHAGPRGGLKLKSEKGRA